MTNKIDLKELYSNRTNFTVIAFTGRNGSGYNRISDYLVKNFEELKLPNPDEFDFVNNSYKKYRIAYDYVKINYQPFIKLKYSEFIVLYFLKYSYNEFVEYIKSDECKLFFNNYKKIVIKADFTNEIIELNKLKNDFNNLQEKLKVNEIFNHKGDYDFAEKWLSIFLGNDFKSFSTNFHNALKSVKFSKHNLLLELLTNNIRKSGNPYNSNFKDGEIHIFSLAKLINQTIKFIRKKNGEEKPTKVVIDSLRNPFEINFFKQRFSAFYLIAVNRDEKTREKVLKDFYKSEYEDIEKLLEDEYSGGKGQGFYKQYVRECIEKSDIHLSFLEEDETKILNDNKDEETSPYFSWKMQLIKYLALIDHPGLVTPSPEERCMQLAYTAKYNSGCISRQVGAAVTDAHYSVKAIGWNNTPEGQVPCNLRNVNSLLSATNEELSKLNEINCKEEEFSNREKELNCFSPFERDNEKFNEAIQYNFKQSIREAEGQLKGRNVCICFKSIYNSIEEGKNQVHTRSLHAEESAFLQITKYGGQPVQNGKLFTTASPCELCSKKAYQLGIKVIYYVDPYPGISLEQILKAGSKKPEVRLFNGAIGNAYHWLYEPLMAYKDELGLILGQNIEDLTKKQRKTILEKDSIIEKQKIEIEELKKRISNKLNEQQ